MSKSRPSTPQQAWDEMVAGNRRFVQSTPAHLRQDIDHVEALAAGQKPFAALFGCSDSRLGAEIIFDVGLGDLFVVRNAGQVIADSILGSLEYSVEVLGVPLIMVLGHDECGAIRATIDATEGKLQASSTFIKSIVSQIEPTVQEANKRGMHHIDDVTALHIEETINDMITRSEIIAEAVTNGSLGIVGANYKLALGEIHPLFMVGELEVANQKNRKAIVEYRIEHDTMGEVKVPKDALYSAQTQRAVENFPISGTTLERAHIAALAQIKKSAAQANAKLGVLKQEVADAIAASADAVIAGNHDGEFPVDIFQTGSGTSSNMNMNEVLANLASAKLGSPVHPNDHVNASQSSNDVFPTSVHVAVTSALIHDLLPSLDHLAKSFEEKAELWKTVVKAGRTHLMDATPVTLGQEFGGYAAQIRYAIERVESTIGRVAEVPLGGTAVGTGINTPKGFPQEVLRLLAAETKLPITEARNHFEAQGARDGLVEASGALRVLAVSLTKINNDLRWMGSGPNAGIAELHIPDLQPGSSIMPGKVNPVIPEAVMMVCARVIGNDATVAWAGATGNFELNVAIPVMGNALLESIRLLANSMRLLADKTVKGLEANVERARALAESSPSIVTPLNKYIGYEAAAKIAKHSVAKGITVREATIELGYVDGEKLTMEQLDKALDVLSMTSPGL